VDDLIGAIVKKFPKTLTEPTDIASLKVLTQSNSSNFTVTNLDNRQRLTAVPDDSTVVVTVRSPTGASVPISGDHERLWLLLYQAKVAGDFLQIIQANPALPFSGTSLYIRESYKEIYTIINNMCTQKSRFLLLGNPGIGKSCFLIYMLYRLLAEKKTVVLRRSSELVCYLFTNGQVTSTGNVSDFAAILNNPDVWYLCDTIPEPGTVAAKTVLTCSPSRQNFKLFEKYQQRQTLYLPIWNLDEVHLLRTVFRDIAEAKVTEQFGKIGGIPRYIFAEEDLDVLISKGLNRSFEKITEATGELDGTEDFSHILIHIVPENQYAAYSLNFASKYIGSLVLDRFQQREIQKLRNFLGASNQIPFSKRLKGGLFEAWAHQILQKGGKFSIRCLEQKKRKINIDHSTL